MSKAGNVLGAIVLLIGVAAGSTWLWASSAASARLGKFYTAHAIDLPVPFPLSENEIGALRAERAAELPTALSSQAADASQPQAVVDPLEGLDLEAIALERAIARGKHLVESRYVCVQCHGRDFGGGMMLDDPAVGTFPGPNITSGEGGRTGAYTAADWDRIVRHGLRPDGRPAVMPSGDFIDMSDRELSDIIAYIRSLPPADRETGDVALGPLGTILVANGTFPLNAETHPDHGRAHQVEPPAAEESVAFGEHLSKICTGCHRTDLTGGPIPAAPPDWIPSSNLTPHADGLAGWTFEDFDRAMREGRRPDGAALRMPMTEMLPYSKVMTETEMKALWAYLSSLEAKPDPA